MCLGINFFYRLIIVKIFIIIFFSNLIAQGNNEIIVTIGGISSKAKRNSFNKGEVLRKQMKFREAINEYKNVISIGEFYEKESEACYNIGLCYCWLDNMENANDYFVKVKAEFPADNLLISFSQYGLSWIKQKEGRYEEAIEILRNEFNSKNCEDYEHNATILFKIGKIYQTCLLDFDKAREVYKQLLTEYPNARIINHPFLNFYKNM